MELSGALSNPESPVDLDQLRSMHTRLVQGEPSRRTPKRFLPPRHVPLWVPGVEVLQEAARPLRAREIHAAAAGAPVASLACSRGHGLDRGRSSPTRSTEEIPDPRRETKAATHQRAKALGVDHRLPICPSPPIGPSTTIAPSISTRTRSCSPAKRSLRSVISTPPALSEAEKPARDPARPASRTRCASPSAIAPSFS